MDEVWCGLDLQLQANDDIAGLHRAAADDLHDPFWPALAECAASLLAGDTACFGVADVDFAGSASDMVGMDTSGFLAGDDHRLMQQDPMFSSSSLSSNRSLSIDSGGTSSSPFFFSPSHPAALAAPQDPFASACGDGDDAAITRAMMAVLSSASPSSSESSSPPLCRDTTVQPRGGNHGDVKVRSSSLAVTTAEKAASPANAGGARQQQEEARTAAGSNSNQMYHMMSERKRREKINDNFQTLRSLLPPCSKKDKTTVLINAASYLKMLESQVSELEERNDKMERHVPREGEGGAAAAAAHRRAKVRISRAPSSDDQVDVTVMVMVECDIVDLVLHVLECLRWMGGVSVLSVDADTYSPQVLLKAIANIKLQITDGDCWNEASFHEEMTKAVHDATSSAPSSCAAPAQAPLVVAA